MAILRICFFLMIALPLLGFSGEPSTKGPSSGHQTQPAQICRDCGPPEPTVPQEEKAEDPCLEKITETPRQERASTAVRGKEQKKATQARIFLDLVEQSQQNFDYPEASVEKKLFYFLDALSAGDPLHDSAHLWHNEGGMSMPQNYQNLVTTLQQFSKAKDQASQRKVLDEAVNHLGWLTSSNYHVPPLRGSNFSDNRYLYDHAKKWLDCVKNPPSPTDSSKPAADNLTGRTYTVSPNPPASDREKEEALKAVDIYENGMAYGDGAPRERFPKDTFKDVPQGGTGKIILAYFGPRNSQLEEAGKNQPLIEVRNYPYDSPEHQHARLFNTQALALDGLGRRITRYQMSPEEAFRSLVSGPEVAQLQKYLEAKKVLSTGKTLK